MTRNRCLAFGLTTMAALAFAACSGGGSSPAPTIAPTPGLAAATDVVGHVTCSLTAIPNTPAEIGRLTCTQVASDARLSGAEEATFRYADLPSDSNLMWGSNTITNDGGSWNCEFVGLRSPNGYHAFDFSCRGGGGHAGLWAYYHQDGDVGYSAFSGWIENRE